MPRPPPIQLFILVTGVFLWIMAASADERITRFASDITINRDASLRVIETITVRAEGKNIRRGIYRDFPTTYKDRLGNRIQVRLEVLEVRRNNRPEPWTLENLGNGVRVRIGSADRLLNSGVQVYEIIYRTTRQLGFFDQYDELYWNVTGNDWGFPIDAATATIRLPDDARIVQEAAYTGRQGERGADFDTATQSGARVYRMTRILAPGEGLSIAIAWPKGYVTEPGPMERASWFVDDNAATGIALAGTTLVLLYYVLIWRRFGRDPEGTTIIPRFSPPNGLSPAATRFVRLMSFDKKAFSAALINMAVKGYLTIEEKDGSYSLIRQPGASFTDLTNGERRIAKRLLFTADSIHLDNKNHELLRQSVRSLRESLVVEYEKTYFQRNTGFFVVGLILSIGVMVITAGFDNGMAIFAGLPLALICSLVVFVVLHYWGDDTDPTFKAMPFRSLPVSGIAMGVIQISFFLTVVSASSAGAAEIRILPGVLQALPFALLGTFGAVFFFLLKRPTRAGRTIMDEIEGFRMYLSTAEEARLNAMNPPDKTPELFEAYLPYALALDVENEWSEKFAAVLATASMAGNNSAYRPGWYRGSAWRPGQSVAFSRSLGSSFSNAIASSVRAPGSSSGSGGGGSSGGGGGGGGGGGW